MVIRAEGVVAELRVVVRVICAYDKPRKFVIYPIFMQTAFPAPAVPAGCVAGNVKQRAILIAPQLMLENAHSCISLFCAFRGAASLLGASAWYGNQIPVYGQGKEFSRPVKLSI